MKDWEPSWFWIALSIFKIQFLITIHSLSLMARISHIYYNYNNNFKWLLEWLLELFWKKEEIITSQNMNMKIWERLPWPLGELLSLLLSLLSQLLIVPSSITMLMVSFFSFFSLFFFPFFLLSFSFPLLFLFFHSFFRLRWRNDRRQNRRPTNLLFINWYNNNNNNPFLLFSLLII